MADADYHEDCGIRGYQLRQGNAAKMQLKPASLPCAWLACQIFLWPAWASGESRAAIARRADVIVVGRLRSAKAALQQDGWHLQGRIQVEMVILGPVKSGQMLPYAWVCSCCPRWTSIHLGRLANKKALWFLRGFTGRAWQTAAPSPCSDDGARGIDELEYYRDAPTWRQPAEPGENKR